MSLPFIDLQAQRKRIETEINAAIQGVVESGRYVLGPEVTELEKQLAPSTPSAVPMGRMPSPLR